MATKPPIVRLGDYVRIRTGKLDANASSSNGEYPFFTCSKDPLKIASYSYDCECVLIAGNGDLNVKYYAGKFDAYQRTYILESKDTGTLFVPYLFQFMSIYVEQLRSMSVGGVIQYIKLGFLTEAKIPLPPLAEQRRIAEVLDRAEALRAKRRSALAQLDSLTPSLFLDLFGDPATNTKQFPAPRLGDVVELRGGFAFKSGDYVPEGIPLVRIGEVNRGGVTRENACFLPEAHEATLARFIVRPGDMLMSLTGTTGKDDYANVILLDGTFDRYFVNQRVALIEPKLEVLDRHYLFHVFRNPMVKVRLTSKSRGIRQANISNGDVLELKLPVPPIALQREFARRATTVELLTRAHRASLAELDALFVTLQHRAFRSEQAA